ncbi:MAG: DUF2094 domain-containing protein [Candidatus Cloacimonetes bacterium]|nr:DUF2094 domain-containing protein [Candidatus Cloacimonadota bacterium]
MEQELLIWGKHPSKKEFISSIEINGYVKKITEFCQMGFERIVRTRKKWNARDIWIFWLQPEREKNMICGCLKMSCDSLQRPFPLLITSNNNEARGIDNWEDYIKYFFPSWEKMKQKFKNITLKKTGMDIDFPDDFNKISKQPEIEKSKLQKKLRESIDKQRIKLFLTTDNFWHQTIRWHRAIRESIQIKPTSVWLNNSQSLCNIFYRELKTEDFIDMFVKKDNIQD